MLNSMILFQKKFQSILFEPATVMLHEREKNFLKKCYKKTQKQET